MNLFTSEAEEEVAEAFAWYESRSPGLGSDFLSSVDAAVTAAAQAPLRYPPWRRGAHRILLRKFPFALFYTVADNAIIVFACFHARRSPTILIKRQ